MEEKLIRKLFFASEYELNLIEDYLEHMAEKGLIFVQQKGAFLYFKESEPQKLHYCIDIFDKASLFDTRPEMKTEEYIEYCKECGWDYLYTNGKLQFFCSNEENPLPIQTDDVIKLKLINKHTLISRGIKWATLLFISIMFFATHLFNKFDLFTTNGNFIIPYTCFFLIAITDIMRYGLFYIRNKRRLKKGKSLSYISKERAFRYNNIMQPLLALSILILLIVGCFNNDSPIYILILIAIPAVAIGIEFYRQGNTKLSRADNIIISVVPSIVITYAVLFFIVFYAMFAGTDQIVPRYSKEDVDFSVSFYKHNELPLTCEKLGLLTQDYEYTNEDIYNFSSIFASYICYDEIIYANSDKHDNIEYYLEYEVVQSSWDFIIEYGIDEYTSRKYAECVDITNEEATLWNANTVYSLFYKETNEEYRIVIYDDTILYIGCAGLNYNESTIGTICDALLE